MEAVDDDDEDMMAMMGMAGFGSTKVLISLYICGRFFSHWFSLKGQHVTGNQDGSANVKKPRTWRQYMNRYVQ